MNRLRWHRFGPCAALWVLGALGAPAFAQVSVEFGLPGVRIGIAVPQYPELVPVPGYPVYYAPGLDANLFFYDGLYWVYAEDGWYSSAWYNGPWDAVPPDMVPYFVLRIPVGYYRRPPPYFLAWRAEEPPRWGEHWGRGWDEQHRGWERWDRHAAPALAPLPRYQRDFFGDRYPRSDQQRQLRDQHYHYRPHEVIGQRLYGQRPADRAPASHPAASDRAHGTAAPEPRRGVNTPGTERTPEMRRPETHPAAPVGAPATHRGTVPAIDANRPPPRQGSAPTDRPTGSPGEPSTPRDSQRPHPGPQPARPAAPLPGQDLRGPPDREHRGERPPPPATQRLAPSQRPDGRPEQAPPPRDVQRPRPDAQPARPPANAPPPDQRRPQDRDH